MEVISVIAKEFDRRGERIDELNDEIDQLKLTCEGYQRFYNVAVGMVSRLTQGWVPYSTSEGLAWRRGSEAGPLVTDTERVILAFTREGTDA